MLISVDCVMGDWSAWSACTEPCGTGSQTATRVVDTPAVGAGTCNDASDLSKDQPCNTALCPRKPIPLSYFLLVAFRQKNAPLSPLSVNGHWEEWGSWYTWERYRDRDCVFPDGSLWKASTAGGGSPCPTGDLSAPDTGETCYQMGPVQSDGSGDHFTCECIGDECG